MQKEVIYIDVDDDITAIIGKIKASSEKIVALVPPKRVGVLQSAVNLRLLERMAKTDKKNLVIITNNPALVALTASAHIPVAKNLQSKPEVAEIPALAVDDDDDIIDGSELPIGDHASSVRGGNDGSAAALKPRPTRDTAIEAVEAVEIDGRGESLNTNTARDDVARSTKAAKQAGPKVKIPNFNSFRKRLFVGIFIAALLVAGLVWAFVFAPAATITITASTIPSPISASVKLGGTAATDQKTGVISSVSQQLKKDATVQFTPTGTADKGTKAAGTVVFKNCETNQTETIPAGTTITTGGLNYTTQASATVGAATGFAGCSSAGTSSSIAVTATDPGDNYNTDSGTTFSVKGHNSPSGTFYFKAVADSDFTGGASKTVTVVTDDDIQRALGDIQGQSTDSAKAALKKQFKNGEIVIDSSFTTERGTPMSSPASGEEVDNGAQATLTVPTTYTMYGFSQSAVKTYLDATLASQLENAQAQQVYDDGISKVAFSDFQKSGDGSMTVALTTTGQIGPKIDKSAIKDQVKGKITGDVQNIVGAISGVRNVEVDYSYFWVNHVPNDTNKIQVEFKLTNG